MINKILILLIIVFPLHSKEMYKAKNTLPEEFQYLIETIQDFSLDKSQKGALYTQIKRLDSILIQIPKDEINFLLKTEIIKFLLGTPPKNFEKKNIRYETIKSGNAKFEKEKGTLSPLSIWLLESIHSDLSQLMSSSHFPELARQIKAGTLAHKIEQKKYFRQFKLLLPLYTFYINTPIDDYLLSQKKIAHELFAHLKNYLGYYVALSQKRKLPKSKTLIFFTKVPIKEKSSNEKVISILDAAEISLEQKEVKDEDQWKPNDNLILFPTPDPSYSPPQELPRAIKSWSNEMGQLYPAPNSKYIPPSQLPLPIRNWIEKVPPTPTPPGDPDEDWIIE